MAAPAMSPPPSRPPRLGRPPRVDLEAILDAAEEVGLERLTSTAVAARLGVSEGTVRHHASSADHLYTLTCSRALGRLEVDAPHTSTWRGYLTVLCDRLAALVRAHPGIESYVVHGPYTTATIELFERLTVEIQARADTMTSESAWLLGSRAVILTASTLAVRSTRYPPGVEPSARHDRLFHWMLDAYLTGAEVLVEAGDLPQFAPTSQQDWARVEKA